MTRYNMFFMCFCCDFVNIVKQSSAGGKGIALVGKGITFDTGGLAIKPRDGKILQKQSK